MVRTAAQARRDVTGGRAPLVLTAELPPDLHRRFTELRRAHYPPERNFLEAHVTLFHALPPMVESELAAFLGRLCAEFLPPVGRVEGVIPWAQGTAIRLSGDTLLEVRDAIAERFHGMMTAQDSHRPRLHVTVQNKVSPAEAKLLQAQLSGVVATQGFAFPALALHRYRDGPWEFVRRWPFRGK